MAPAATFRPGPMIDHDRPCRECGYNLRGLFMGGNCPECGRIIGSGRRELQSNLIDAPKSWLIVLAVGLGTMCGAWLVLVSLLLVAHRWIPRTYDAQLIVGCIVGTLWSIGTLIVLRERPVGLRPKNVDATEARRTSLLRIATALTQAAIIPAVAFDAMRLNGGHPITGVLAIACGAAFVLGQIPLCYWLARVCDWSDDATLAHRFRSLGWAVALIAFLNVIVLVFKVSTVPPLVMFATYWGWLSYVATAMAVLAVIISIAQMALDIRWIFRNADSLADRDEARAARDAESARRLNASADLAKPAPLSPEAERLMRELVAPGDDAVTTHAPSALPPPGMRPLHERVIPKAKDGAYRLEDDAGRD